MKRRLKVTTALSLLLLVQGITAEAETITITNHEELENYLTTQEEFIDNVVIEAVPKFQMTTGQIRAEDLNISQGTFSIIGADSSLDAKNKITVSAGAELDMEENSYIRGTYQDGTQNIIDIQGLVDMDASGIRADSSSDGQNHSVLNIGGKIMAEGTDDYIGSRETNIESDGILEIKQNTVFNMVGAITTAVPPYIDDMSKEAVGVLKIKAGGILDNHGDFNAHAVSLENQGKMFNREGGTFSSLSGYMTNNGITENGGTIRIKGDFNLNNAQILPEIRDSNEKKYGNMSVTDGNLNLISSHIDTDKLEIIGTEIPASANEAYKLTVDKDSIIDTKNGLTAQNIIIDLNGGKLNSRVDGTSSTLNINNKNSKIKSFNNLKQLNINTDTSVKKMIDEKSSVDNAKVSKDATLFLNISDADKTINLTVRDTLEIAGKVIIEPSNENTAITSNTIVSTKIKGGTLDVGYNEYHSPVVFDEAEGGTLNIGVKNITPTIQENNTQNGKVSSLTGTSMGTNAHVNLIIDDNYQTSENTTEEIKIASESMTNKVLLNNNVMYNYYKDKQGTKLTDNILEQSSVFIRKKTSDEMTADLVTGGLSINDANVIAGMTDGKSENQYVQEISDKLAELIQIGDLSTAGDMALKIAPETAPIIQAQVTELAEQLHNSIATRLSGNHHPHGMSSGEATYGKGAIWFQGLMTKSKLNKHDGFKSDSDGLAFGLEHYIDNIGKVGIGYAYTDTQIKSYGHKDDVDTNSFFAYGEYKPSAWYVNTIFTYNQGKYSETKYQNSKSKFDVDSFSVQSMGGYEMLVKNTIVSPEIGMRYIHAARDKYQDTLSQYVKSDNMDFVTALLGINIKQIYETYSGFHLQPNVHFQMTYDLKTDNNGTNVYLSNGSGYQVYGENLDKFGIEMGIGLTADYSEKMEVSLGYDCTLREKYHNHIGLLQAKYKF